MSFSLTNIVRKTGRMVPQAPETVRIVLPPKSGRFCTADWRDNDFYLASALREVCRLTALCGVSDETRFLDIGCGQGRIAIGLRTMFPSIRSYTGIDVHQPSIAWCNKHLARPNFRFMHIGVQNERYNPKGQKIDQAPIPLADASCDVIFLYSVFTHMRLPDIDKYLKEMARLIASGGRALLTIYAEDWHIAEDENPAGYLTELGKHVGPLHRVVIDRSHFERMCREAGFSIAEFRYRSEPVTQQSVFVLEKTAG